MAISGIALGGTDPGRLQRNVELRNKPQGGWDCSITVTFKPTATGARPATLNIKDAVGTQIVEPSRTGK